MARIEIPHIEFVHILRDDWLHFKELDPLDRLELISLPGAFAIGAVDLSIENAPDVGLMVVLQEGNRYVLEWLCVDPEHRRLEVGGALLTMLFDMALSRGFKEVAVRVTSELKMDVEEYFRGHLFEKEEKAPDFFRVSIVDFFRSGKHLKAAHSGNYEPVKELGAPMRNKVMDYACSCSERFSLYDGQMRWEYINGDISFAALDKNGNVSGVFLCMTLGINCYPLLLAAKNPAVEQNLITHSMEALHMLEKHGYMLSTFCRSDDMSELAEEIMQGKGRIRQKLLVAETSRYAEIAFSGGF